MTHTLNALSCRTCKLKKVRCSRVMPTCGRCISHGIECEYPERVKRKSRKGLAVSRLSPLSAILERLEKVEEHVTGFSPGQSNNTTVSPNGPKAETLPLKHTAAQIRIQSAIPRSSPASPATPSVLSAQADTPRTCDSAYALNDLDIASILTDAVNQVQKLRLQQIAKSTLTEGISIPPELAKQWIHTYFTHMHTEVFISLVDAKLIKIIPDIIDMPQVHLDAAIQVVYYGILYHGCSLPTTMTDFIPPHKLSAKIYLCCLRALPNWQREATGTTADFMAAIFMARAAAECFDYDLSWKMYKQACEYATALNLHNLDGDDTANYADQATLDADRKGFWELMQIDLFFRLIYNKAPTLTGSMSNWRVNLPWLTPESQPDMHAVPTMTFLISSRITLTLIDFFQLIDDNPNDPALLPKVERLCEQVDSLIREWQVLEWIQQAEDDVNSIHWWLLSDVYLTGYTCIIFMIRKCSILECSSPTLVATDSDIPKSPLAVEASRNILSVIYRLLAKCPVAEILSFAVGFFQAFVPYACLASNIIRAPSPAAFRPDLELLEQIAERVTFLAKDERDFFPLARALNGIVEQLQKLVDEDGSACMSRMSGEYCLSEPC